MKKIESYQCEVCKNLYNSEKEALNCEARGKEKPLANLGQKVMYNFGDYWSELTVEGIKDHGHEIEYKFGLDDEEGNYYYEHEWGNDNFKNNCKII